MGQKSPLGRYISLKVKEREIPIDVFAESIGMKKGNYYQVLKKDSLDFILLLKIAEVLKVPVENLLELIPGYSDNSVRVTTTGEGNKVTATVDSYNNPGNCDTIKMELRQCHALLAAKEEIISAKNELIKVLEAQNV